MNEPADGGSRGGGAPGGPQIDRLRRSTVALRGTSSAPDALAACIRTEDRALARRLACAWIVAVDRAVTAGTADARDRAALTLLARVLDVPVAYFVDAGTRRAVDERASDAARRAILFYGPCRGLVPDARRQAVHDILRRELDRIRDRTSG